MPFASGEVISAKSFSQVSMLGTKRVRGAFFWNRELDFKEVKSGEGGGRRAEGGNVGGAAWWRECFSFRALKRRDVEKEKKILQPLCRS